MRDVLVLCYHGVSPSWPSPLAVTPEQLELQLSHLQARGYEGAAFHDAIHDPPAERTLAVTFDDAYRSVFERAAPILDRHGIPGTVFAPVSFIGLEGPMSWEGVEAWQEGAHREEMVPMSWAQLAELADRGWEVGSHTRTHARLQRLDAEALEEELESSRLQCEHHLARPCRSLAFPFGDHDLRVRRAAAAAGYTSAGALAGRAKSGDPLGWPRVPIYRDDGWRRFAVKTWRSSRRLRESWIWQTQAHNLRRHRPSA